MARFNSFWLSVELGARRFHKDSIAEAGIAPICLGSVGYRASIAEIAFEGGGVAPPLRMLFKGETSEKGERVSHPIGHVETPKKPIARNMGVSLR